MPKRRQEITTTPCVIIEKSEVLRTIKAQIVTDDDDDDCLPACAEMERFVQEAVLPYMFILS